MDTDTEILPVQQAVKRAKEALQELFFDEPLKGLALEEIELMEDGRKHLWAVTLGFYRSKSVSVVEPSGRIGVGSFFRDPPPAQIENRVYKTVYIDAASGNFVKMDIRQVP